MYRNNVFSYRKQIILEEKTTSNSHSDLWRKLYYLLTLVTEVSHLIGTNSSFFNCIIAQSPDGSVIHNLARSFLWEQSPYLLSSFFHSGFFAEVVQYKNKNVCNIFFSLTDDMKPRSSLINFMLFNLSLFIFIQNMILLIQKPRFLNSHCQDLINTLYFLIEKHLNVFSFKNSICQQLHFLFGWIWSFVWQHKD